MSCVFRTSDRKGIFAMDSLRLFVFALLVGQGVTANFAYAIDCSRAKTVPELAICNNPALKAFDDYLSIAYSNVKKSVSPESFGDVRREQIQWIRDRDLKCSGDVSCMIAETQARTAILNGFAQRMAEKSHFGTERWNASLPPVAPTVPLNPQQIYLRATQSVVVIYGADSVKGSVSQGSGVVVAQDVVATNCHVIQNADSGAVMFRGQKYSIQSVHGDRQFDYCILKTLGLPAKPATIGALADVAPGQRVYSIGSPRGLELTIAEGLVSGIRKKPPIPMSLIQTSAPISPGSSGGGLFDEYGRVVGITTFLLNDSQNLNFALPIELSRYLKY